MREVKREWREQDGQSFEVFSTDIHNHNILEAAAGSTGDFPGADKWDVKTYLRIKDQGGTNMKINADHVRGLVEIELQGSRGARRNYSETGVRRNDVKAYREHL